MKLNYETKIVDLNLKLEELNQIRETIGLYKSKNEELSTKLSEKENELIETRINKISIPEFVPQKYNNSNKEAIQRLNENISAKDAEIMKLESQLRNIEAEWKSKYSLLEQNTSSTVNKKNKIIEGREEEIADLENTIKNLRKSNADLETRLLTLQNRDSKSN